LVKYGPYYKIGKTTLGYERPKSIARRMNQIEPRLPFDTIPLAQFQCFLQDMDALERLLHAKFSEKRQQGEWFELSNDDLLWMLYQEEFQFWPLGWETTAVPGIGHDQMPDYGLCGLA
jgi:Meiotically up-regulated gene 113